MSKHYRSGTYWINPTAKINPGMIYKLVLVSNSSGDFLVPGIRFIKIMQSTGLKDCKGNEIFEGDILRIWIDGIEQDSPYRVSALEELYHECHHDDLYYRFTGMEVIGNIYRHSELLKAKS